MNTHGYTLQRGSHERFEDGHCLLELAAHLAGESHSHHPSCVCEVLTKVGIVLNDAIDGEERRTRLLGDIAPLLVNTRSPEARWARSMAWLDWLARAALPAWVDLAGLRHEADTLRRHAPIEEGDAADVVQLATVALARQERPRWSPASHELCQGSAARALSRSGTLVALNAVRDLAEYGPAKRLYCAALKAATLAAFPLLDGSTPQDFAKSSRALFEPTVHRLQESAANLLRALATQKEGPFPR